MYSNQNIKQLADSPGSILRCAKHICCLISLLVFQAFSVAGALAQADTESTEPTEQDRARVLEITRELGNRQQAISDMQSSQGIYSPALQEAYSDLAAFYVELEDYVSAVDAFRDALQLARINTGLYSEQQLPVIEQLIDSNGKLTEWQEVDDLQQLNYHISSRLFGFDNPAYVAAAEQYGDWKRRLLSENLLDFNYRSYTNAADNLSKFYESVIANVEAQPNSQPSALLKILYGKTETDLTIARSVASTPYTAFEGTVSRYINRTRCQNVRSASGQISRQCVNVQVENPRYRQSQRDAKQLEMNRHARSMRRSLEKLQLINEQSTDLPAQQKQELEVQITQLQTQLDQLIRLGRRRSLF
ncbi:MAG: hypothetical protein COA96_09035 [SAR86 cluster bacterium]|uniref:Uncharacterized protein n=1 Tax=SAR86 cluster bacterium TaxID=2030880 RepID=A0A2A5AZB9_9GAMM|nr:MAG: hypothetical protein COA96_09035 [SAR86 cluster bacterium]